MGTEKKSIPPATDIRLLIMIIGLWLYTLQLSSRIDQLDKKIEQLRKDTGIIHAK